MYSRRWIVSGGALALASGVSGCSTIGGLTDGGSARGSRNLSGASSVPSDFTAIYGDYPGEKFPIAAFDYHEVDRQFLRQYVDYRGKEPAGTVIIDPSAHHLYFVESPGRATRYGIGVGREGFAWAGNAQINMKRDWPDWVPPAEMVARQPEIAAQLEQTPRGRGVKGGPRSPLGARAMYLFGDGRDLGYRIHGTTEPETIGTNVSSGCIRMVNQDIVHLYPRTVLGTRVVVLA